MRDAAKIQRIGLHDKQFCISNINKALPYRKHSDIKVIRHKEKTVEEQELHPGFCQRLNLANGSGALKQVIFYPQGTYSLMGETDWKDKHRVKLSILSISIW